MFVDVAKANGSNNIMFGLVFKIHSLGNIILGEKFKNQWFRQHTLERWSGRVEASRAVGHRTAPPQVVSGN